MKQMISLLLLCCVGYAIARYVIVPVEDVLDPNELTRLRLPRGAEAIGIIRDPRDAADYSSPKGEYVDFGAHTGSRGSYGWYADFPVPRQN